MLQTNNILMPDGGSSGGSSGNYNIKIMDLNSAKCAYNACIDVSIFSSALDSFAVPGKFSEYLNIFGDSDYSDTLDIPGVSVSLNGQINKIKIFSNEAINEYEEIKSTIMDEVKDKRSEELMTVHGNIGKRVDELNQEIYQLNKQAEQIGYSLVWLYNNNTDGQFNADIESKNEEIAKISDEIDKLVKLRDQLIEYANTIAEEISKGWD